MRERLLQLLPEIGVPSVPGVTRTEKSCKPFIPDEDVNDTPLPEHDVTDVPTSSKLLHPLHPKQNNVYQEKPNKISFGTPAAPGTPVFAQDVIESWEERAAIMEFDAGMSRQDAEAAAKREVK